MRVPQAIRLVSADSARDRRLKQRGKARLGDLRCRQSPAEAASMTLPADALSTAERCPEQWVIYYLARVPVVQSGHPMTLHDP